MVCNTRPSAAAMAATMSTLATSIANTSLPPRSACDGLGLKIVDGHSAIDTLLHDGDDLLRRVLRLRHIRGVPIVFHQLPLADRSEERRVGQECRSRSAP